MNIKKKLKINRAPIGEDRNYNKESPTYIKKRSL